MSENQAPYNSTRTSSGEKDSSSDLMAGGKNPLLVWIDCKVESTPNRREHWTKTRSRNRSQKLAVRKVLAGLNPPEVPGESKSTR
jgi:hypothetical protein